jgi:uncharacterized repeat protein (TIGR01451 family)
VRLTDVLPPELTLRQVIPQPGNPDAFTNNQSGNTVQLNATTMGAHHTDFFTVVAGVNTDLSNGQTVINTASVSLISPNTFDPNPSNDSASFTSTVTAPADVSVGKSGDGIITCGGTATYTLTVTNLGPCTAQGVQLIDALPPQLTALLSVTPQSGNFDPFINNSFGTTVQLNFPTVAAGNTDTFVVKARVSTGLSNGDQVIDTASVSLTSPNTFDPNPSNDSASFTSTVTAPADVSVVKSSLDRTITCGGSATYTLTVTNTGPCVAQDVQLLDSLPPQLSLVSAQQISGTDPFANHSSGNSVQFDAATVAIGSVDTFRVTAQVSNSLSNGQLVIDTASVSETSGKTTDNNPANDTSSFTSTVTAPADVAVGKTGDPTITCGGTATYTLSVSNLGPCTAQSVRVSDALPPQLTLVSAQQISGTDPFANHSSGNSVQFDAATVAVGSSDAIRVVARVSASLSNGDQVIDNASVSLTSSATFDPNGLNNSASFTSTVTAPADVSVTKSGDATITCGARGSYTITLTNNGPCTAQAVQLLDALPAGLRLDPTNTGQLSGPDVFLNTSAGSTAQFTAATVGVHNVDVFVVAFQASTTLTQGQTLTDTASVSQTSSRTFDPNSGNDTSSFTSTVTAPADLSLTGICPPTITAGTPVSYTLTVANAGPCAAQNATLTEALPTGLTLDPTQTKQTGGPDSFSNTSSGNTASFTGTIGVGNSDTFVVVATADSGLADGSTITVVPTVAVDPTKNVDHNPANNSMTCTSTVTTVADLSVAQTPTTATEGDTFSYTLSVHNAGPSDAQGVTVTDIVPSGLRLISGSFGSTAGSPNGNQITFSLGTLKAGATATGTVLVQALEDGNPTNTVTASTTTTDANSGNIRSDQPTPVAEGNIIVNPVGSLGTQSQFSPLNNVMVATFTHANGVEAAGHFSATIDWGDQSPTSTGTVTQSGMTYIVTGTHTYNRSGSHSISVTVSDEGHLATATTGTASVQQQQQGATASVSVQQHKLLFLALEVGGAVGAGIFDMDLGRFVEISFGFMPGLSAPIGFSIPLGTGGVLASSLATLFGTAAPSLNQTSSLVGVLGANTSGPAVLTIGTANGQPVLVSVIPDPSGTSIQYLVQSANGFLVLGIQKLDSNGNDLVTLAVSTVGPKGAVTKSSAGFFHSM